MNNPITVETVVRGSLEKVWQYWNEPEHITQWAFASNDWEAPAAENDVREGGRFKTVMAAKDGSSRFDFTGTYTTVVPQELIEYVMDGEDERKVSVKFEPVGESEVKIIETFDPESENSEEMQRQGWQAILENFREYVESDPS